MDLTTLRYANQKLQMRASLAQRRDVIAALSGYKASRLMLTDRGIRFTKVLLNQIPFGLSIGSQYYQLSRNSAKGRFKQLNVAGD